jgi:hypothetical protein
MHNVRYVSEEEPEEEKHEATSSEEEYESVSEQELLKRATNDLKQSKDYNFQEMIS